MKSYTPSEIPEDGNIYLTMKDVLQWIIDYDKLDSIVVQAMKVELLQDIVNSTEKTL